MKINFVELDVDYTDEDGWRSFFLTCSQEESFIDEVDENGEIQKSYNLSEASYEVTQAAKRVLEKYNTMW